MQVSISLARIEFSRQAPTTLSYVLRVLLRSAYFLKYKDDIEFTNKENVDPSAEEQAGESWRLGKQDYSADCAEQYRHG